MTCREGVGRRQWLAGAIIHALMFLVVLAVPGLVLAEQPYAIEWIRQFGSADFDHAYDVAQDGQSGIYVTGSTEGNMAGPNAGVVDFFLNKYDAAGNLLWSRQHGSMKYDKAFGLAYDGLEHLYLAGYTAGDLAGTGAGGQDAFVCKYDLAGNLLWSRQFGAAGDEIAFGVAADASGSVYVAGRVEDGHDTGLHDAFLTRYDADGNHLWTRRFGTPSRDVADAVAVDGLGNAYITGSTRGELFPHHAGSADAYIAKYDASGQLLWGRQFGTNSEEEVGALYVDSGGRVYITGGTHGELTGPLQGYRAPFLAAFDSAGSPLWVRQYSFSSADENDYFRGITGDGKGGFLIAGYRHYGNILATAIDAAGTRLWKQTLDSGGYDVGVAITVDAAGNAFLCGTAGGRLGDANLGYDDAFLVKLVPEPATLGLLAFGGLALIRRPPSRRKKL